MEISSSNKEKSSIVVVGGASMDICGKPDNPLVSGDSNPGRIGVSPGGVARNIAENIARMGACCHLVSVVGNDDFGKQIIEKGTNAGIQMDSILKIDEMPTSVYLSVLDRDGDMAVAINAMDVMRHLSPEYLKQQSEIIRNSSIVVADTNLLSETFEQLISMIDIDDQMLVVDAVSSAKAGRIKPFLHSINTLKVNRMEAHAISGIVGNDMSVVAHWFHQNGIRNIYITLGPEGVFFSGPDGSGTEKPPRTLRVANAGGAGDAFVAAVAFGMLKAWNNQKILKFANSAANVAIEHEDTINPEMSLDRIMKNMEEEYGKL